MLGAIIGDIVGSRFEMENYQDWTKNKTKDFELLTPECRFTDDTVMSLAVAKALMDCGGDWEQLGECAIQSFRELGRLYPDCGFGGQTREWILSDTMGAYHSCGNGAAMRVSACGYVGETLDEVKLLSRKVTEVTHDHPDGILGAEAVAVCVFMAAKGYFKHEIAEYVEKHYYSLRFTLDEIRDGYQYGRLCQDTVPQAIVAFMEGNSFEGVIRNAISLGGDSDTLAAIAGSIAEPYFTVWQSLCKKAMGYLDTRLTRDYYQWLRFICDKKINRYTSESKLHDCISFSNMTYSSSLLYAVRIESVGKITDQALLANIAFDEGVSYLVRKEAVEKITSQAVLQKLASGKNTNDFVRATALDQITDQAFLKQVALETSGFSSGRAAVRNITDQAVLEEIARDERVSIFSREVAVEAIASKDTWRKLADECEGLVRERAAEKLNDQELLAQIALDPKENYKARDEAISKLTNKDVLMRVALDERNLKAAAVLMEKSEVYSQLTKEDEDAIRKAFTCPGCGGFLGCRDPKCEGGPRW